MREHPDDAALMDSLAWTADGACEVCVRPGVPVALVDGTLICREHLASRLHFARCEAIDAGRERPSTLAPAR